MTTKGLNIIVSRPRQSQVLLHKHWNWGNHWLTVQSNPIPSNLIINLTDRANFANPAYLSSFVFSYKGLLAWLLYKLQCLTLCVPVCLSPPPPPIFKKKLWGIETFCQQSIPKFHSEILASSNFNRNKMLSPGLEKNYTLKYFTDNFPT